MFLFAIPGSNLFPSWYFWTACLAISLSLSSLNGSLGPKQICIMWWSTCSWVLLTILVKTSFSLVRRWLRLSNEDNSAFYFISYWIQKNLIFLSLATWLKLISSIYSLCCYYWPLSLFHGCCFQSLSCWRCNTRYGIMNSSFYLSVIGCSLVFISYLIVHHLLCHALLEAPWRVLCTSCRLRRVFAVRRKSWFPWSWRVWIQWSFCTSAHSHNRICSWGSFKYSFLSSFMGSQVMCFYKFEKYLGPVILMSQT